MANTDGNIIASAKGRRDMSDLWLVDTGCGHDFVSATNVKLSAGGTKRLLPSIPQMVIPRAPM